MKILLFGGSGQLGYEITTRGQDLNFEVVSPVQSEVDIVEREQVQTLAERVKPDVIINSAAYTAVDKAEEEREAAFRLNQDGARNVAYAARSSGARFIHISTDYVFDGSSKAPLSEEAPTRPINVYGESKLAGEKAVQEVLQGKGLIVRTSSLHGQKGINFVHTMIKLFKEKEKLHVVDDQFMSPTWAGWLAEALLDLCRLRSEGTVHACGKGVISWHEFASAIYEDIKPSLGRVVDIQRTSAVNFPRPARRPAYSAMDTTRLTKMLGREPLDWREGLRRHLAEIGYAVERH
jgi:dTDP-4-dehydrorhamnose reductase